MAPPALRLLLAASAVWAMASRPLAAQTFQGRVVGPGDEPVSTALVRLEDGSGRQVAFALSDTLGRYVLAAPEPGEYVVVAERLGYEPFRSHPLAVGNADGTYPVDIVMRAAPLPIEGIAVSTDRLARLERGLRLEIGLNPRSLRVEPIFRAAIEEMVATGRNSVTDLVRWSNLPNLIVREGVDGPCFAHRNRGCIPVYLNGQRMGSEWIDVIPLDIAETIVVVMPGETIMYGGGGILLYSGGWIAR